MAFAVALTSSQRTFYYSPSATPKVTRDAVHLLLAFELNRQTVHDETVFVPVHWQLVSLEAMEMEMKLEFNQCNCGLYGTNAGPLLIGEGPPE